MFSTRHLGYRYIIAEEINAIPYMMDSQSKQSNSVAVDCKIILIKATVQGLVTTVALGCRWMSVLTVSNVIKRKDPCHQFGDKQ